MLIADVNDKVFKIKEKEVMFTELRKQIELKNQKIETVFS